jgi:hypothetical protein
MRNSGRWVKTARRRNEDWEISGKVRAKLGKDRKKMAEKAEGSLRKVLSRVFKKVGKRQKNDC